MEADSPMEALQAAELAGMCAYARALLASLKAEDPAVVALVVSVEADSSITIELHNSDGMAVGGYRL